MFNKILFVFLNLYFHTVFDNFHSPFYNMYYIKLVELNEFFFFYIYIHTLQLLLYLHIVHNNYLYINFTISRSIHYNNYYEFSFVVEYA